MRRALPVVGIAALVGILLFVVQGRKPPADDNAVAELKTVLENRENAIFSILGAQKQALAQGFSQSPGRQGLAEYQVDSLGVFTDVAHRRASNVYFPQGQSDWSAIARFLHWTNRLEGVWAETKKQYGNEIAWQYIYHLKTNGLRGYPWTDFSHVLGPTINWPVTRLFPDVASARSQRDEFCTQPYEDNGGIGINISCCGIGDPSGNYDDLTVYCVDLPLRDLLLQARNRMAHGSSCPRKLQLVSDAKTIQWHSALWVEFSPLHNEMRLVEPGNFSEAQSKSLSHHFFPRLGLHILESRECES